ncbi:hypothetical protein [Parahaliea mediterranea]|uniref:hypothetical protein n=1 Tax=Parahaliea mediterranea TaxID=651086 RepID=UPI0013008055|nr:hypothetical protein [Parahaliea mediterranea]
MSDDSHYTRIKALEAKVTEASTMDERREARQQLYQTLVDCIGTKDKSPTKQMALARLRRRYLD